MEGAPIFYGKRLVGIVDKRGDDYYINISNFYELIHTVKLTFNNFSKSINDPVY